MVLVSNSRRVQESLRTLEELAKVPGTIPELDSEKFKQARFNLYTIEENLLSKLLRQDKMKHIVGLYPFTFYWATIWCKPASRGDIQT